MPRENATALPDLPIAAPATQTSPTASAPTSPAPEAIQLPKPIDPKQPVPVPKAIDPKEGSKRPLADPQSPQSPYELFGSGDAENYLRALYSNQQGYRIKVDQAVELGLINAREFQDRREDLYLAALPVTLERFSFATQAFAAEQAVRRSVGADLPGAGEFWELGTRTGLAKRFPTGAAVLFELVKGFVSGDTPELGETHEWSHEWPGHAAPSSCAKVAELRPRLRANC